MIAIFLVLNLLKKLFNFFSKNLLVIKNLDYICSPIFRARSSVGSEHLVYTQGVRGSNPFAPTSNRKSTQTCGFFISENSNCKICEFRRNKKAMHLHLDFLFAGEDAFGIYNPFAPTSNRKSTQTCGFFISENFKSKFSFSLPVTSYIKSNTRSKAIPLDPFIRNILFLNWKVLKASLNVSKDSK